MSKRYFYLYILFALFLLCTVPGKGYAFQPQFKIFSSGPLLRDKINNKELVAGFTGAPESLASQLNALEPYAGHADDVRVELDFARPPLYTPIDRPLFLRDNSNADGLFFGAKVSFTF